jgi:hypothetical protein
MLNFNRGFQRSVAAHLMAAVRFLVPLALFVSTASAIDTLVPDCANEGDAALTLTVLGSELEDDDNLRWNGMRLNTTFVSGTETACADPRVPPSNGWNRPHHPGVLSWGGFSRVH